MSSPEITVKTNKAEGGACGGCASSEAGTKQRFDWFLWGSAIACALGYGGHLFAGSALSAFAPAMVFSHGVFELLNLMWWGVAIGIVVVGFLERVPREFVVSVLGRPGGFKGIWRATAAGVLLDLCSHGILMVGMKLYERGASLGQVMAFLIASPWNSLALTLILWALIGFWWTLAFILVSMGIALLSGLLFERLVAGGRLPKNPHAADLPDGFRFWPEARAGFATIEWSPAFAVQVLWDGVKGSRMVLRWLLFGVALTALVRAFVSPEDFSTYFGPTALGLAITVVAATILEICSEGSTPIAADIFNRAGAPGNAFTFLMAGVATDYTEIMSLKDTTRSWAIAFALPIVTVPQVLIVAMLMNALR